MLGLTNDAAPDLTRETVTLPGPRGPLSGELCYGDEERPGAPAVLLIGPHPYMGGTMENNVVATLAGRLAAAGHVTLRFSYRDVPADEVAASMLSFWTTGHAPQDATLIDEARGARHWLGTQLGAPVALVGYSFGAHAAAQLVDDHTPKLVLIAPTVRQHDLAPLTRSAVPKLVLYSNDDFATSVSATECWYAGLAEPRQRHCFLGADHFFKGQEAELARRTAAFLEVEVPVG